MTNIKIPLAAKCYFSYKQFQLYKKNIILCTVNEESAIKAYQQMTFFIDNDYDKSSVIYFPSLDTTPYDRVSPSKEILGKRAHVLSQLSILKSCKVIVTAAINLMNKLPSPDIFSSNTLLLFKGLNYTLKQLSQFLINNGFIRTNVAMIRGEFAIRGEIIDIVTGNNQGYRINFAWNYIESIKIFEINTQLSNRTISSFLLTPSSELLINDQTIATFKENFSKLFGDNHASSSLYSQIISKQKSSGFEYLTPLFYKEMHQLVDYLNNNYIIIYDNLNLHRMGEYENHYNELYKQRTKENSDNSELYFYAIPPQLLIFTVKDIKERLINQTNAICIEYGNSFNINLIDTVSLLGSSSDKKDNDKLINLINNNKYKIIIIFYQSNYVLERIKLVVNDYGYGTNKINFLTEAKENVINFTFAPLSSCFLTDKYLFISEQDIFGNKFSTYNNKTTSQKKLVNILKEIDNIKEQDLVVHRDHGIGRFIKIENISAGGILHECLKLSYRDDDLLYVPVENIKLVKRYGFNDVALDKLGLVSWQKRQGIARKKIQDIAEDLIKITAERKLSKVDTIEINDQIYDKFCQQFPYLETDDQLNAVNDIKNDLKSGELMDRLVCGDIGFGKTEVAMRAACLVAFDKCEVNPQIAVIVPTTILCRQHYKNFIDRFQGVNIKIECISRLVLPKETKRIKKEIASGSINIIIGTHKLLAHDIKFNNLKLLIIDEEQNFGVKQKEQLKSLKIGVHILSLSATPIPRTLQMSMLGVKDLSLISTPPIDRVPVRTTLVSFDKSIIREALVKEKSRGGHSFYVCPKIKDIDYIAKMLNDIVPELSYKIAHGKMPSSEIDKIMLDFYEGNFDILISTTIIQSGIDIVSTNTIIIHKCNHLGLSQLYQLRGRVGRGKVKGYAYLTLSNNYNSSTKAIKRLEILQNIDYLGAGFAIASYDMDLRGVGNLVGSEQSGHIKEVGIDLYYEMLDEALKNLKYKTTEISKELFIPNINLAVPVYIPDTYIPDTSIKLGIYRRIGDLLTQNELDSFKNEMVDRFGIIPSQFNNLLEIIKIKHKCIELGVQSIDSGPNGFVITFNKNYNVSEMVFSFINKFVKQTQIKPNNKLIFLKKLTSENTLLETMNLLNNIEKEKSE